MLLLKIWKCPQLILRRTSFGRKFLIEIPFCHLGICLISLVVLGDQVVQLRLNFPVTLTHRIKPNAVQNISRISLKGKTQFSIVRKKFYQVWMDSWQIGFSDLKSMFWISMLQIYDILIKRNECRHFQVKILPLRKCEVYIWGLNEEKCCWHLNHPPGKSGLYHKMHFSCVEWFHMMHLCRRMRRSIN